MLNNTQLSYTLRREVRELLGAEVPVGVSSVGRGQRNADSAVEGDRGGSEEAVGNPLGVEILHTLQEGNPERK